MLLTADGFLKILAADSGVVLRSVFLSTLIKYRYRLRYTECEYCQLYQLSGSRLVLPIVGGPTI